MAQSLEPYPYLAPRGGLNTSLPGDLVTDLEMTDCRCVRSLDGHITKMPGTQRLGGNLPLSSAVVGLDLFTLFSSESHFLAQTASDIYRYNANSELWENITKATELEACESGWSAGANVTVAYDSTVKVRGASSLKMTLSDARSDGDQLAYKDITSSDISAHNSIGFWIRASANLAAESVEIVVSESNHASGEKTGTYTECLTTALTADTWTFVRVAKTLTAYNAVLSVSVYANASLASGLILYLDDVRAYTPLTGSGSDFASTTAVRKNTESDLWWLTTNGINPIQKFTGSGSCSNLISSYPAGLTSLLSKHVVAFKNHTVLLNVTEEGNPLPQRVRWSDSAVPDDFLNGNASYSDLSGAGAIVMGVVLKNDYLFVARSDSLWLGSATGDTDIFAFDQITSAIGCPVGRTVRNIEDQEIFFLGRDNKSKLLDVYSFTGGGVVSVGGKIRAELANSVNPEQIGLCYAAVPHDNKEYILVVPGPSQTECDTTWVFNYELRSWTRGSLSTSLSSVGWWSRQTSVTWLDLVGSWEEQDWRWSDLAPTAGAPTTVFGDASGYVYEYDSMVHNEDVTGDNTAIDGWFTTKDLTFTGMNTNQHIARMDVQYKGSGLSIDYSTDGGTSWTTGDTLAAASAFTIAHAWFRIDCNKVRFRFRNNSSNGWFQFREARIWWRPAGRRLV